MKQWIFCIFLLAGVFLMASDAHASSHSLPKGHLDFASTGLMYGWAYDADTGGSVAVHIYINGQPTVALVADKRRDDLVAAGVTPDPFHGFEWVPPPLSPGEYVIEAYAINVPLGLNPQLKGTKTIIAETGGRLPRGAVDYVGQDRVSGWAYDKDAGATPIAAHFYINGVFAGATLADAPRPDLVAAGIAEDKFHGFTWLPPRLPAGMHTLTVWAINVPEGPNPQIGQTVTVSVAEGEFGGIEYIDNGVVKVGMHLSWGGAVTHISHRDFNLIDDHDTGRLMQASFYDQNAAYPSHDHPSWGWNPVQAGDKHNRGSTVLAFSKTATSLYAKTRPLEWNPDNKGGGAAQPVESQMMVETWLEFSSQFPQLVQVRQRATLEGAQARTGNHEVPALFMHHSLKPVVYLGQNPWNNGEVSRPLFDEFPYIETLFPVSERWVSFVNPEDFGLTLYTPEHPAAGGFNAYWIANTTNYTRPALTVTLSPNVPWEINYSLIVGNWWDARSLVYQLR